MTDRFDRSILIIVRCQIVTQQRRCIRCMHGLVVCRDRALSLLRLEHPRPNTLLAHLVPLHVLHRALSDRSDG